VIVVGTVPREVVHRAACARVRPRFRQHRAYAPRTWPHGAQGADRTRFVAQRPASDAPGGVARGPTWDAA
jgi:hypothetical protein